MKFIIFACFNSVAAVGRVDSLVIDASGSVADAEESSVRTDNEMARMRVDEMARVVDQMEVECDEDQDCDVAHFKANGGSQAGVFFRCKKNKCEECPKEGDVYCEGRQAAAKVECEKGEEGDEICSGQNDQLPFCSGKGMFRASVRPRTYTQLPGCVECVTDDKTEKNPDGDCGSPAWTCGDGNVCAQKAGHDAFIQEYAETVKCTEGEEGDKYCSKQVDKFKNIGSEPVCFKNACVECSSYKHCDDAWFMLNGKSQAGTFFMCNNNTGTPECEECGKEGEGLCEGRQAAKVPMTKEEAWKVLAQTKEGKKAIKTITTEMFVKCVSEDNWSSNEDKKLSLFFGVPTKSASDVFHAIADQAVYGPNENAKDVLTDYKTRFGQKQLNEWAKKQPATASAEEEAPATAPAATVAAEAEEEEEENEDNSAPAAEEKVKDMKKYCEFRDWVKTSPYVKRGYMECASLLGCYQGETAKKVSVCKPGDDDTAMYERVREKDDPKGKKIGGTCVQLREHTAEEQKVRCAKEAGKYCLKTCAQDAHTGDDNTKELTLKANCGMTIQMKTGKKMRGYTKCMKEKKTEDCKNLFFVEQATTEEDCGGLCTWDKGAGPNGACTKN